MRRAQLVFGGALALCLLLHPASAGPHDDVPTTDDDELDEEEQVQEYVFIKTVSRELLQCVEHFCPEDKFDWRQFGESQSDDPYVNSLEMREELAAIGLSLELSDAVETLEEAGYTFQPPTE